MKLKILSYNIHKGFDWGNRNYFLQEMKDLITSSEADLVFLQEVVGKNDRYKEKGLIDSQFEFFAESIWTHYSYARNALYDHGHHGNLILSRYPIESWENINLTTNAMEKRGLLVCKINIPHAKKKDLFVACVHLDLLHKGRKIQYQIIKKKMLSLSIEEHLPVVIAGDFNDWNKKSTPIFEELGMFEAYKSLHGRYARTFPAKLPMLSLDRIYVKNVQVIESKILPMPNTSHFSDHLPLFCEVDLNEG